jgi:hypothetical protein
MMMMMMMTRSHERNKASKLHIGIFESEVVRVDWCIVREGQAVFPLRGCIRGKSRQAGMTFIQPNTPWVLQSVAVEGQASQQRAPSPTVPSSPETQRRHTAVIYVCGRGCWEIFRASRRYWPSRASSEEGLHTTDGTQEQQSRPTPQSTRESFQTWD